VATRKAGIGKTIVFGPRDIFIKNSKGRPFLERVGFVGWKDEPNRLVELKAGGAQPWDTNLADFLEIPERQRDKRSQKIRPEGQYSIDRAKGWIKKQKRYKQARL
jgi:hypothetical protein